jgi:virulence-associated protein VapD
MGSIGVRYAGYGAIGSDDSADNFMEWDVNYLEINMGLDHKLFNIKKGSIYIKGSTSVGFLVQGSQTINNTVLNLKKVEEFDKSLIDIRLGAGFSHPISDNFSFYVQYMYGKSLVWTAKPEKLRIESNNISFGLLIDISKKKIVKLKDQYKLKDKTNDYEKTSTLNAIISDGI